MLSADTVLCLVTQSRLTLCNPMDCSLPGSSVHGDSPGKNTGVGYHALLQGISPTQGLNPGLLHCTWILYCLRHQESPRILEWVTYPFFQGNLPNPGIEPGSPALQADSSPAELPGTPWRVINQTVQIRTCCCGLGCDLQSWRPITSSLLDYDFFLKAWPLSEELFCERVARLIVLG